jgi:beta-ribofuranosylaminobenzene 5'-phosphate synthase
MGDMTLFDPGELISTLDMECEKCPTIDSVKVTFPNRIHISPIDCNRFDFGKAGGGGIGFAVKMDNHLEMSTSDTDKITADPIFVPLIKHYIFLVKRLFNYSGGFRVNCRIAKTVFQHSGLGSSIAVACSVLQTANFIFGNPIQIDSLRKLIATNFVESCNGKVVRGLETGVGSCNILRGGLSVVGDDVASAYHTNRLNELPVVLLMPNTQRPDMDKPESIDMLKRSLLLDSSYRYTRAYRIIMDIIPAIEKNDLDTVGNVVWDFQFAGTHISMIQAYLDGGIKIYETLNLARQFGGSIVGMSSVGPLVYAICENPDPIISEATNRDISVQFTQVSPKGVRIVENE